MSGKAFSGIDYNSEDDMTIFLYCLVLVGNNVVFSLEEFRSVMENKKQLDEMVKELEKSNIVLNQFFKLAGNGGNTDGEGEACFIKDLAATLIMAGLDARYVMYEMELSDIPVFISAYEKRKREEMEAGRLWAFLTAAPHIDTRKVKTPEDYFPFPWEMEERKKRKEKEIADNETLFRKFMNGEYNHLLKK
jgi:hypothetical protein